VGRVEVQPGVELFVRDVGSGPPVVLLHGWTMSHLVWDRQVAELAVDHRVVLPDLRGHGDSDKPVGDYSPARHAADVSAVLDALDLRDVTLVGWSFGGLTAMQAAISHGGRLARLVLVNAAGPKYLATDDFPHGHSEEALQGFLAREREETAAFRRFCMEAMPHVPYDDLVTDWLWSESMRTPSWAAAPMLEAYARADLRDGLAAIRARTLILHGAHDVFCAPEAARYVAEHIAGAELVEFPDCGHSPHYEAPERFMAALRGFLAGP
jgi:non-heme chloroperoxidase